MSIAAPRRVLLDALLAFVVAAGALVAALLAGRGEPTGQAVGVGGSALILAAAGAVLMRRRYPLAALLVAEVAAATWSLTGHPGRGIMLAPLIACYTLAAARGWRAGAVGALMNTTTALIVLVHARPDLREEPILNAVAVSIAAAAAGATMFYYRQHQRAIVDRLTRQAQATAEAERRLLLEDRVRLARDLHDIFGHAMAAISVQAGAALHVARNRPDQAITALEMIKKLSDEGLAEARPLFAQLRADAEPDPGGRPEPGLGDLDALLDSARANGLRVEVHTRGTPEALPPATDLAAYRIVQEALTNVRRHARATEVRLTIDHRPDRLELTITDNGVGVPGHPPPGGHGIAGMRERVALAGGRFHAGSPTGGGFEVACTLPAREPT
ncbi:histidine kinase [Pseudonocardia eucalypti]|uniref:histidine kinase n=1 Tax=Pseudonocardia eucalypti TaxID=648755 RepID=A0ABP9QCT2_9PSEU|nr:signal transduction histidine kinase [Pseudonocardia eucalypti]